MENATPGTSVSIESSQAPERESDGDDLLKTYDGDNLQSTIDPAATFAPVPEADEHAGDVAADSGDAPSIQALDEERTPPVVFTNEVTGDAGRLRRHRVREAAREAVEENLLPRVEKLRQASNVVLDEAAYDPSLRFVLIAVALFLVFLVILLASKVLG
jgi:hypothetical protein